MTAASCLGFGIECGVLFKGAGVVLAGLILFVGSVYVILAAVFGRWMGYLVLMVCFAGWMIIQSSLWAFGFWSQGPETKSNLGPRGREPAWVVASAGSEVTGTEAYPELADHRSFEEPNLDDATQAEEVLAAQGAATTYLAAQANADLDLDPFSIQGVTSTQFTVDDTRIGEAEDGTPLTVVEAHYTAGGPQTLVGLYFDDGSVAVYSTIFLVASVLLFVIHLPLLDRAERSRKAFLTGGAQPAWYGPA